MTISCFSKDRSSERGGTLIEFAVVASAFFMMLLAICAGSNLYFTHNALVEATRRGARFAATQQAATPAGALRNTAGGSPPASCDSTGPRLAQIRNYAIYGNTAGTGTNLLGLQPANICVEYTNFGVGTGSVSVSITGYTYSFVIPGINRQITMPAYRSTAVGESVGTAP
jgi:Flp pilus assembly protein TadG